ncbi:MAG: guanylate kinase [Acidobacteria bacterium]|nr:guanylate kinase [Acidobacteriota bacterium]MCB9378781.1 guanylate kinase [Holophagales bacterium]
MSDASGEMFLLSAPSGAGKTTLIRAVLSGALARLDGLEFSVSHTTRKPRGGEVDGHDYHFVDAPTFQKMIVEDSFLEWAEVHGHYYGTSVAAVTPRLEAGIDMVIDLDVQGAERLMSRFPGAHSIFIMPPTYEDLERRLRGRSSDDPAEIARRLAVSLWEIRRFDRYDYVIINDDVERASWALAAIVIEKRQRRERVRGRASQVLAHFQRALEARREP